MHYRWDVVYRDAPPPVRARTAPPGIVADMVRQFADPYAFLRELVQNGLDAGATRIDVRFEQNATRVFRTSVADDGAGMSRADIEGPLLSLFTSSKEDDPTKIGKYGVGFVSVFALDPTVVLVETRTASEAWLVRLHPDHAYDLVAPKQPLAAAGTRVTLVQPMNGERARDHVERSLAALRKWCRHAKVDIHVAVIDERSPELAQSVVVNEPFATGALVSISADVDDAHIELGAGRPDVASALPLSFTGFYNHGLTLFEAAEAEPGLEGFHLKIESARLLHTISRDAVKRNAELQRYLAAVPALVTDRLWPAIIARSLELAEAIAKDVARGGPADPGRVFAYGELLAVARTRAFAPTLWGNAADAFHVPLLAPVRGASTMRAKELGTTVWTADTATPLVGALADLGIPVVPAVVAPSDLGLTVAVDVGWSLLRELEADAKEAVMLSEVRRLLGVAGARVARIALVVLDGTKPVRGYRLVDAKAAGAAVLRAEPGADVGWGRSTVLLLDADDAAVRLARRRARSEPTVAAHLLARSLLLRAGPLAAETVDALLEAASDG